MSRVLETLDRQIQEVQEVVRVATLQLNESKKLLKKLTQAKDKTIAKLSSGTLYIVTEEGTSNYKIGITTLNMTQRLGNMQTGNSNNIYTIAEYQTPIFKELEVYIHNKYKANNIQREWFEFTLTELEEVKQCIVKKIA